MIKLGIDRIDEYLPLLSDGRVALLTSVTGRSSDNVSTVDILRGRCALTALLAPEHGIRGDYHDGRDVADETDAATSLPVYSLYSTADKHLTPEMLDKFDILVYDIQDVGLRFYTFISTLYNVMHDCAAAGKRVVVLDRPDPLGGEIVEGSILRPRYRSFVGCCEIPVRYALTVGEFARMINEKEHIGCDLAVVPLDGWHREQFTQWGKIWHMPSLALSTYEATVLYAGTCIFEGTALSEGRGTSAPMRIIGAPGVDGEKMLREFHARKLPGAEATPVYFDPTASKHRGEVCGGLMLHVTDYETIRPVALGVELLDIFRTLYPEQSVFNPPYNPGGRRGIELLTGRGDFVNGFDKDKILSDYARESESFRREKTVYHMY